ncbi:EAL domain-containing protein [Achromobacter sp. UMC71]|uniref:EAL domain-containing response regulator n=1 Tax=Achromobacter sp. UMC71 TaxID=1862320 RepID=UPI0015FF87B7|nr:EAL domain-containing protein [Achromobacter sp. UMC71]MBB1628499.1 hypothetical protein [Achromobacter sp. UMC71]
MINTILVVDEYDTHRVSLSTVLRKATGAHIGAARNGQEALAQMRGRHWDVVVLDLDMPDMTGLQLIDALTRQGGAGGIVITSRHQARVVQAAAAYAQSCGLPTFATLEKPLKISRMRDVAASLARNLRAHRQTTVAGALRESSLPQPTRADLLEALETHRIEGFLQPQHYADNGALRGAEMLARWRCDDGSLLEPSAFLPAFEEEGLMQALTDHMLRLAFSAQVRFSGIRNLTISINIPTGIACSVDWAQHMAECARRAGADPARMVIEIIEDGDASAIPTLTGAVTQLRLRGFNCAIDDFGTGGSSLDRLLWVPFNELKIDRHLISHARHHPHARRILWSTINMARALGTLVVVEGVELEEDLKLVKSMGGQVTQGYLHGKAMTADAFEGYATAGRASAPRPPGLATGIALLLGSSLISE